ncbi:MAG: translation initiation factor 6 [Thermoprotei archaeon ex4572_64]|nr:MAG: translation initiation factor 6 [Thermoprotei archaeon ex4572_64]
MSTSFDVVPITIYGNTVIGVYIFTNNKYTLVPLEVPEKIINVVENILKTEVVRVSIAKSPLIGIFITGNDNGVLLPNIVTSDELSILKKLDLNVEILETKYTAISNLILTNNEKTIVSPLLEKESIKKIQDTLNTEVIVDTLCNTYLVGSIAVANSRGVLLSPEATNQDIEKIKKIFYT